MIRLSMNVISSAIKLLRYVEEGTVGSYDDLRIINRIGDIDVDDLVEMLEKCCLLRNIKEADWGITQAGNYVVYETEKKNYGNAIRRFLAEYVVRVAPAWSRRIPYGRNEALIFMTKDEKSCFYEASLINDTPTDDEVVWWDKISAQIRKTSDEMKLDTGREGEKLTLEYEMDRTGVKPKWMSVDTNLAGYDIMSVVSNELKTTLLIEVKTSRDDISGASCHISTHEWEVSNTSLSYLFYFWSIYDNKTKLAILNHDDIMPHIPENKNEGEWESVKIPFAAFENRFFEWRKVN